MFQDFLTKRPEDLTIGEKIKRATIDDSFTWHHVYDLMTIKFLKWWDLFLLKLPNLVVAILVFLLFFLFAKFTGRLLHRLMKRSVKQESIRQIVVKLFRSVVLFIGFLVTLIILDLGIIMTSILGLAGVASLAVGLAIQGALNNTFSGVILSFLPNLKIGDWVETDGLEGTISEISLRSVQILKPDNNLVMVPNSQILENPFTNFSLTTRTRVTIKCGVSYDSDLKKVMQLAVSRIESVFPQSAEEEVEFFYQEFADSAINFILRFWGDALNKKQELQLKHRAIIEIKDVFDANGITIPFPIRTIQINREN
jgi:small conductance mechanosensitive channel